MSKQIIKMKEILATDTRFERVTKTTFVNRLHGLVNPITRGFFTDNFWEPVQKVWKLFSSLGIEWRLGGSKYDSGNPPTGKTWEFEINFVNNIGKVQKLYGRVRAAGAGTIEDPLSRYDVTMTVG